jgi:hypothetical protein
VPLARETSIQYFSCSGGTGTVSIKKRSGHITPNLCFACSGSRNVGTLFFMLGWDSYRFDKNCAGTHYVELVFLPTMGYVDHVVHSDAYGHQTCIFHAQVGLVRFS